MKYLLLIPLILFFSVFKKDNVSIISNYKSTEESFCNPNMSISIKKNSKTNNYYFDIIRKIRK